MRTSGVKTAIPAEEALARETTPPEALAASGARQLDEAAPCTRSHVPNARTRKTLRDADAGKNLTRYTDEDDLFRKLGIELGQDETQAED
ncbi:MAG TPA: hypothetical protein VFF52_30590 [Isosphaeraceae bacterium]|nr:hypothetical protein [Isosphaeraceae bacterium]